MKVAKYLLFVQKPNILRPSFFNIPLFLIQTTTFVKKSHKTSVGAGASITIFSLETG
jgi:hypothetical protein